MYHEREILQLNSLSSDSTLVGYIYGGIESSAANIFFINDGTQSSASNQIFKVYVVKNITGIKETKLNSENVFNLNIFPNPSDGNISVSFFIPSFEKLTITLFDMKGSIIKSIEIKQPIGKYTETFDWSNLPKAEYILQITNGVETTQKKLIFQ
jgi:hypothetical protein